MKLSLLCFLVLLLPTSCAWQSPSRPPPMISVPELALQGELKKACARIYPGDGWQFVHSIEFAMTGGGQGRLLGVTALADGRISCALMTIEGLTLFAARDNGSVVVLRALPPFDRPAFAAGLINDLRAIFVPPAAKEIIAGRLEDGQAGCRMTEAGGSVTDILPQPDGCWRIQSYSSALRLTRSITARSCPPVNGVPVPEQLELSAPGPQGYVLKMRLLRSEKVLPTKDPQNEQP